MDEIETLLMSAALNCNRHGGKESTGYFVDLMHLVAGDNEGPPAIDVQELLWDLSRVYGSEENAFNILQHLADRVCQSPRSQEVGFQVAACSITSICRVIAEKHLGVKTDPSSLA